VIVADTLVTDGLVVVTYDSEKLTYVGVETEETYVAMHAVNAEEPGVVKISWVAPGPYDTDGSAFGLICVLFEGVEEESTIAINGLIHDDEGNTIVIGEGVDTSELEKAIADAEAVRKDKYTNESVAAMEEALKAAKAVLENPIATQDEVDAAAKALRDAIKALKPVDIGNAETGDQFAVGLFAGLALISAAALVVVSKRRYAR
jgi:hypothetical protein